MCVNVREGREGCERRLLPRLSLTLFCWVWFGDVVVALSSRSASTDQKRSAITSFVPRALARSLWGSKHQKEVRPLEIESRANPWKGLMLPLHHRRFVFFCSFLLSGLPNIHDVRLFLILFLRTFPTYVTRKPPHFYREPQGDRERQSNGCYRFL